MKTHSFGQFIEKEKDFFLEFLIHIEYHLSDQNNNGQIGQ